MFYTVVNESEYDRAITECVRMGIRMAGLKQRVVLTVGGASVPGQAIRNAIEQTERSVVLAPTDNRVPYEYRNTAPLQESIGELSTIEWLSEPETTEPMEMARQTEDLILQHSGGTFAPAVVVAGLGDKPVHFASLEQQFGCDAPLQSRHCGFVPVLNFSEKEPPQRISITLPGIWASFRFVFACLDKRGEFLEQVLTAPREDNWWMLRDAFRHPRGNLVIGPKTAERLGVKDCDPVVVN